jgi:RNA polymerase sigma factor (sigma-70 family)
VANNDAIATIFLSIRAGLARAVSSIVPPREIEDVVQETYVRVCQANASGDIHSPRAFMFQTARNIALNYLSKADNRLVDSVDLQQDPELFGLADATGDPLALACSGEEFALFCDAVRRLPLQCRRAFILQKVYGHSYRDIAQKLGITEKTVEKHIAKGLLQCRKYLHSHGHSTSVDGSLMLAARGGER